MSADRNHSALTFQNVTVDQSTLAKHDGLAEIMFAFLVCRRAERRGRTGEAAAADTWLRGQLRGQAGVHPANHVNGGVRTGRRHERYTGGAADVLCCA